MMKCKNISETKKKKRTRKGKQNDKANSIELFLKLAQTNHEYGLLGV